MPRDQRTSTEPDPATSDDPLFRAQDDQQGDQSLRGHGDPLRDPLDDHDPADTPIGDGIATGRHADGEPSDTPGEWVAGDRGPDNTASRDGSVVPGQPGEPALERTDPDAPVTPQDPDAPGTPGSPGATAATEAAADLRTTNDPEVAPDSTFTRGSGAPTDPNAVAPTDGDATEVTPAPATTASPAVTTADTPATTATPDAPVPGAPGTGSTTGVQAASASLVPHGAELHDDWARIQSSFVDDPRGSVSQAADLVSQVTTSLVNALQEREQTLRGAWDKQDGQGPDTENLRNALRDYRAFFEMLTKV